MKPRWWQRLLPKRRRRRLNIHAKVLTIAIFPALVVTLILVVVVYRSSILQGHRALNRQAQMLTAQLAATLEYALSSGAMEQLPATVENTVRPATEVLQTRVESVKIFDPYDQVLYTAPPIGGMPKQTDTFFFAWIATQQHDLQTFSAPIYLDPLVFLTDTPQTKRYLGKVQVVIATAPIKARLLQRFFWDIGLVLVTFVGALALAHGIGRRLSGAIQEAAQAILHIKGGHLDVRLPNTETNEIGTLQEGVNLLAEAITRAKERLEAELTKVRGEHSQVLEALQLQTREAQQANHAKSLFLAKVSHEMRTPLYSIQGLAEQLLKSQHDADAVRQLRTLLSATHQLHRTISDILDFTHLESGKYTPLMTVLKPWAEIEHCLETMGSLVSRQNLYVDVIVHPNVPDTVIGDAKAYRTIVANLMANAVKFTDAGGIGVQLTGEVIQQDGIVNLQLQVSDTGCGIPPEKRQVIFAPFEQVESALNRRYEGTGLGLSIVKGYCDVLGGRIQVESRPGQGSTFTVSLPFTTLDTSHAPAASSVDKPINLRVLIADTRSTFCASIRCRLESLCAQVSEQLVSPQTLVALTPPISPYDLLVVRDLLRFPEETLADLCQSLRHWSRHLMCLHTRDDPPAFQRLRQQGTCLALWSGVSRSTLQEELKRLLFSEAPDNVSNPNLDKLRPHLDGKTVLVVEDFEINRHIMTDQLQYHGLQVVGAGDGDEAIAVVRQTALDLILMDIQMPGKDGIKAIEEIRALPAGTRLPILGFTASADKPTHQRIIAAGANGVLIKPLSEEELVTAVYQSLMTSPFST